MHTAEPNGNAEQVKERLEVINLTDYLSIIQKRCDDGRLILFRGQQQNWDLVPKVSRLNPRDGDIQSCERRMLSELKRRAIPHTANRLESELDWLALAQHHGMPTRLLDWTTNPIAALWFAVEKPANKLTTKNVDRLHSGVVWIFAPSSNSIVQNKVNEDPFDGNTTKVFQPDHISPRITAQSGWFTVHKFVSTPTNPEKRFIPLNRNTRHKSNLTKVIIPGKHFAEIRREVVRCGFDKSSIYPGIEGICQHIGEMFTKLPDEP